MKMFKSRQRGFTIVESLVVVIILGIIAAFGLPQYSKMLANTKLQNKITEWRESFYYAQREAIRLKHNVKLCPSDDGENCKDGADFKDGWIIYDVNEGKILRDYPPATDSKNFTISLSPDDGVSELRFLNNGRPKGLNSRSLTVIYKYSTTKEVKATFNISASGRIVANSDS